MACEEDCIVQLNGLLSARKLRTAHHGFKPPTYGMDIDAAFEKEVRRIASLLWPTAAAGSGSVIIDGREHDGVYETEECIHLVECTTSRQKYKAVEDTNKMSAVAEKLRKARRDKAVKCWFVTREDVTADQRTVCQTAKVAAAPLSFHQFQAKIIDARDYLQIRKNHRFGSAYDPRNESFTENVKYVEIELPERASNQLRNVRQLSDELDRGGRFVFLGDYGVGKSMTLREIFFALSEHYSNLSAPRFPVYFNLREHHGQTDPAEILERHARSVGFNNPAHLVRAWRAGYVILLIDGFDEVSSLGLEGGWKRLREARFRNMEGVRRLVGDSPGSAGIALAGRDSFFDSDDERRDALKSHRFREILLGEFNEIQIKRFLENLGYSGQVPAWMPSRPLLLGTLFSAGMRSLAGQNTLATVLYCDSPPSGWDFLLDELCRREAKIEAGISGELIRLILENLATRAREKEGGLGPLTAREMTDAFTEVCGYEPADQSLIVLQRLPGMGRATSEQGARIFVDVELADACKAGDFVRFVLEPYTCSCVAQLCNALAPLGETGMGIAAAKLVGSCKKEGNLKPAFGTAHKQQKGSILLADLAILSRTLGLPCTAPLQIANVTFDTLSIVADAPTMSAITFKDCYFNHVEIESSADEKSPTFDGCLIHEVDGRVSADDLPAGKFVGTEVEVFLAGTLTTDSISKLTVADGVRVTLSVLKKLFVQSLSGRKEQALFRGLDSSRQRLVPQVLALLQQHNLVTKSGRAGEPIWLPVRRQRPRVLKILQAPSTSEDLILKEAVKVI